MENQEQEAVPVQMTIAENQSEQREIASSRTDIASALGPTKQERDEREEPNGISKA